MFGNDWDALLNDELSKDYYKSLGEFLKTEYEEHTIYPQREDIFNALKLTAYHDVRVVIFGQDPYHGENQAHGLAFSVPQGIAVPPSLLNIYKELKSELGCYIPDNGCLTKWAKQGVLLLNSTLTVQKDTPNSHHGKGWEQFTDAVAAHLNRRPEPVIFMLWGASSRAKRDIITAPQHFILEAPHPSPLSASRGFFGCGHFAEANSILKAMNKPEIDWQIENTGGSN